MYKVLILAGGKGTRISEETTLKPKPMIEIGQYPILVHIMKNYSKYGYNNFIILAGYKQEKIKDYFMNFNIYSNDTLFKLGQKQCQIVGTPQYDWQVLVSDTGLNTNTAGRVRRAKKYLLGEELFLLTYGDALGNINIEEVIQTHKLSGKKATICVYNYAQDKGVVKLNSDGTLNAFREKSDLDSNLINIGFMVINTDVLNLLNNDTDNQPWELILEKLAAKNELNVYVHKGFWQCMDTLKEKEMLDKLANQPTPPWEI